jgi:hypothetical protein
VSHPYHLAQRAVADLKAAIVMVLEQSDAGSGLANAEIGRRLGIYTGHKGHEGHISRTMLALLEAEGVVRQDRESKLWKMRGQGDEV